MASPAPDALTLATANAQAIAQLTTTVAALTTVVAELAAKVKVPRARGDAKARAAPRPAGVMLPVTFKYGVDGTVLRMMYKTNVIEGVFHSPTNITSGGKTFATCVGAPRALCTARCSRLTHPPPAIYARRLNKFATGCLEVWGTSGVRTAKSTSCNAWDAVEYKKDDGSWASIDDWRSKPTVRGA
jgi:hypothetical protein